MIDQENTLLVISEYEKKLVNGFNSGNVSVADEVFQPDCVIHINGNPQRDLSLSDFKQMVAGLLLAFPDLHFTINDQFTSGERLVLDGPLKEQTRGLSVKCQPLTTQ